MTDTFAEFEAPVFIVTRSNLISDAVTGWPETEPSGALAIREALTEKRPGMTRAGAGAVICIYAPGEWVRVARRDGADR
jgi:hypothetical protein